MTVQPNIDDKLAALRAKMAQTDTGGGGREGFWTTPLGVSTIRIMPEVGGMQFFYQEAGQHFLPGEGDKVMPVYCPSFTTGGALPCPICEVVNLLYKGTAGDREMAEKLLRSKAYWMNIVVRDPAEDVAGNTAKGPYIWTPGVTIFRAIQSLVGSPSYGDIADFEKGCDLEVEKTGKGKDTKYQVFPRRSRDDIPLHSDPEVMLKLIESAQDLSYAVLSENPEEDKDLSQGLIVKLLPYDRMVSEFGIYPGMQLNRLAAGRTNVPAPVAARLDQKRHTASTEEALATPLDTNANPSDIESQLAKLRNRLRTSSGD